MKNIILIGMPASGKSTVGVLLAKSAGMGFVDTDLLIQSASGRLLYKMLEEDGIEAFLKAENETLSRLVCANCVIATGGSAVYCESGMSHLKELGRIIYLRLPCEAVESRLKNIKTRGVVMKNGKSIKDIYLERTPLYERYADITVDGSGTAEETVERILKAIEKEGVI